MADSPSWLRAVLRAERTVGGPLGQALNSDEAAGAILGVGRLVRAGLRTGNAIASNVVHVLSLPSHRDVKRLEISLARLSRTVEELAQSFEESRSNGGPRNG